MNDALLGSIGRAVEAAPDDLALRLHYARLLLDADRRNDAVVQLGTVLAREPGNGDAGELLRAALTPSGAPVEAPTVDARTAAVPPNAASPADASPSDAPVADTPANGVPMGAAAFDWSKAEREVDGLVEPMFVGGEPASSAFDVERPEVTLADVGGLEQVKARIESAFLTPLRNPELRALYGSTLRGGLLLYGPPGCGKTFIARAIAGELGANFVTAGLSDLLDMYMGRSERNVHELFQVARRAAPCVIFLDELDAIGQRRSMTRNTGLRTVVIQLLEELDGMNSLNDGVFVLAATNQPWDVDPALRRPGRLDRTLLVLPPDLAARRTIFAVHLRRRPVEGIDLDALAKASDGLTGADISYVCQLASERALLESAHSGTARMIGMADLRAALREVRPSTGPWLESARNVVEFGDDDGTFAELRAYLKKANRL
jgi:AAA+ superfamily predicted ATPase